MFAVIKTGGKQYRVAAGQSITVMHLAGEPGEAVLFDNVLMVGDGANTDVGVPLVSGASVAGEITDQARSRKIIAFKKRRRKDSKRKRGHRQDLTIVQINEILTGGAKPSGKSAAKAKPAPKPAAAPAADDEGADASIAAGAAAAVAAAKAAGVDTDKFSKLDKAIGEADDLKLINGVGPAIEKKLNETGVYHFWQMSALSQDDIDAIEEETGFKGRAERDEWKQQALDLIAGKPPRTKADM